MDPEKASVFNSSDWTPVKLTLVEFPKGDLIGELLAYISLAPLVVCAGFGSLILFRRDLHTVSPIDPIKSSNRNTLFFLLDHILLRPNVK